MVNVVCRMAFVVGSADSGSTPTEVGEGRGEGEGEGEGGRESGIHVHTYIHLCVQYTVVKYTVSLHTGQTGSNGGCEFQGVSRLQQTPVESPQSLELLFIEWGLQITYTCL